MKAGSAGALPKAGLLLIDMLLNLIIMIVLIENIMATRNRIETSDVSPLRVYAFHVEVRIQVGTSVIDAREALKRGQQPRAMVEFNGPQGRIHSEAGSVSGPGGVGALQVRDYPVETSGNQMMVRQDVALVGPAPGLWLMKVIVIKDQIYGLNLSDSVEVKIVPLGDLPMPPIERLEMLAGDDPVSASTRPLKFEVPKD